MGEQAGPNLKENVRADRELYVIVRGVQSEHAKIALGKIEGISDPKEKLRKIRHEQWIKRQELQEGFGVSEDYRGIMQTLGLLEEMEESITQESNKEWIVWPTVKRVEEEMREVKPNF